ncbi:FtsX-like permease family protein [Actinospica durhamensis]|uniref:FtsX-like permease family protein n=1 Tax=Actinospica durhamensis TaxID=1508375 RepID=A0A941EUI2_9ACTN|nr:ABC transporter permease [Actinospica durhamensis]MBR7836703.1 FtsX-like permease family protein [Actinospica durhamensis]
MRFNRWLTSWLMALRVARRQVLRDKARNALIVAMLALPVFGTVGIDTLLTTALHPSAAEKLTRQIGGFDAEIQASSGGAIVQSTNAQPTIMSAADADGSNPQGTNPTPKAPSTAASLAQIRTLLPQAVLTPEQIAGSASFAGENTYATVEYLQVDLGNPDTRGIFDLVSGRLAGTAAQIDLSPALAADLGVRVGQPVTLEADSAAGRQNVQFTVAGLVELPNSTNSEQAFALPSAPAADGESMDGWFVSGVGPVSWDLVKQFDGFGFPVVSRAVVLDPPPASQVPYSNFLGSGGYGRLGMQLSLQRAAVPAAIFAIVIGVALLEVVLLAGPAFAVSARRREREYAMLGAAGADGAQLRRIVLADGVVLGAVAGVAGLGLGFGAAAAFLPFVGGIFGQLPGAVHVSVPQILGVALLAVFLGLCSALVPARAVARREIMATLAGRRTEMTGGRRHAVRAGWGVLLAALGLVSEYFGARISPSTAALLVTAGIAMIEVGAIMCTSAIVNAAASLSRLLPLGPRLALRDSARHSGRTTPAVAAMFAAVAGAVAAGTWLESSAAQQRAEYTPLLRSDQVAVQNVTDVPKTLAALKSVLPNVTGSMTTESVAGYQQMATDPSLWTVSTLDLGTCVPDGVAKVPAAQLENITCGDNFYPGALVGELIGGPQTLQEVTGTDDAAADRVLDQGGIVVTQASLVENGTLELVVQHDTLAPHAADATQTTKRYTLPAVYLNLHGKPDPGFIMSPAAASRMGLVVPAYEQSTLLIDLAKPATAAQVHTAEQIVQGQHLGSDVQMDPGVQEERSLVNLVVLAFAALLALGAAAIATGLALADGRADQQTLAAVGGSPWTRRWLAGSTALVITGLGVLIGVPIGFVISIGLVRLTNFNIVGLFSQFPTSQAMPFTVPWLNLGAMAVAVPLVTALGAMLLSASRAPGRIRVE